MRLCDKCKKYLCPQDPDINAKYCGRCTVVSYCSVNCQRADWPRHKQDCQRLAQEADANRVEYEKVYGKRRSTRGGTSSSGAASSPAAGSAAPSGSRAGSASGQGPSEQRMVRRMCSLCGGRKPPFTLTQCCGRVVCSDLDNYVLMSYGRESCARNHDRYTMCATHHHEGHSGSWKDCQACRSQYSAYDWWTYGSNPPNLTTRCNYPDDVLDEERPPLPKCAKCSRSVDTACEAHSSCRDGLLCQGCIFIV